jgi:SanA protein
MKWVRTGGLILGLVLLFTIILPLGWWSLIRWRYAADIHPIDAAPAERVAIVFGARVYPNGRLSTMLRDRVETAVQLYHAGQIDKILMSGDNSHEDYNEPAWMTAYAIERGVAPDDIQPDYAGRRTYDTCYRAKEIFQLEAAVLVTQDFHLTRALFTCESLGLTVEGVAADRHRYSQRSLTWSTLREIPATAVALIDVIRRAPAPVLGEPIPIE